MAETQKTALAQAAQTLQDAVQASLSTPPGGDHTKPWLRTGSLQNSIKHRANENSAVIGSDSPVAVAQELGTHTIPPRPFLSTTASVHAQGLAQQITLPIVAIVRDAMKRTTP